MAYIGSGSSRGTTASTMYKQDIVGDGSTIYVLTYNVGSSTEIEVFKNGTRLEPEVGYTASGNSITFAAALTGGDDCWILYIGKTYDLITGTNGTAVRKVFYPDAGTTTFNVPYTIGFVDVYLNGVKLANMSDFTASNGTTIVLTEATVASDVVDIIAYGTFEVANAVTTSDIGVTVQAAGSYEPADATILKDADIGVTVQAYDADTAKTDVAQTFTAAQKFTTIQETFSEPSASTTTTYYNITGVPNTGSFSLGAVLSTPSSVRFKPDGTKMYAINSDGAARFIYQYSLSTPWDTSTATYDSITGTFGSQEGIGTSFYFKSDGSKVYVVGTGTNTVYQYTLPTPWVLTGMSYDSVSFAPTGTNTGVAFKDDGTKMYVIDNGAALVRQYTLPTPWVLTGATADAATSSISGSGYGLSFSADGSKLFYADATGDVIYRQDLTTPWDVSTATANSSVSVTTQTTNPTGVEFSSIGDVMYVTSAVAANWNLYDYGPTSSSATSLSLDCSTATVFSHTLAANTVVDFTNVPTSGTAYGMTIKIVQDAGASGFTVTWPASVDWAAATAPTLTATASAVDVFTFYTHDGGTTWYGFVAGQAMA